MIKINSKKAQEFTNSKVVDLILIVATSFLIIGLLIYLFLKSGVLGILL